jgi:sorting nexin-25
MIPVEVIFLLCLFLGLIMLRYSLQIATLIVWTLYYFCYYSFVLLGTTTIVAIYTVYFTTRRSADSLFNPFTSHTRSARSSDPSALLSKAYFDYRAKERATYRPKQFLQSSPTQKSIDEIINLVSRDFIASWFHQYISSETVLIKSFDKLLRFILKSFADRLIVVCTRY